MKAALRLSLLHRCVSGCADYALFRRARMSARDFHHNSHLEAIYEKTI